MRSKCLLEKENKIRSMHRPFSSDKQERKGGVSEEKEKEGKTKNRKNPLKPSMRVTCNREKKTVRREMHAPQPLSSQTEELRVRKKKAYEQEDQGIRSIDIQTHPSLQPLCSLPFSLRVARAGDHLPQHAPDDFSA